MYILHCEYEETWDSPLKIGGNPECMCVFGNAGRAFASGCFVLEGHVGVGGGERRGFCLHDDDSCMCNSYSS